MSEQKKYFMVGDCTCQPWRDRSFALFMSFESFKQEEQITCCPWCGKKLVPFLTKENCPKRTKEELKAIINSIDFGEFFGCVKGMKFAVEENQIRCYLRSEDFIGCFQNLQRQYPDVWFEYEIVPELE